MKIEFVMCFTKKTLFWGLFGHFFFGILSRTNLSGHSITTGQRLFFAFLWFCLRYNTMRILIWTEPKKCVRTPNHDKEAIFYTLFYDSFKEITPWESWFKMSQKIVSWHHITMKRQFIVHFFMIFFKIYHNYYLDLKWAKKLCSDTQSR